MEPGSSQPFWKHIMQEHPTSVPLSQLVESEANVRQGALDEAKVRSLAASIAAHGLIYPLLVTVRTAKGRGKKAAVAYAVAAGRRRFAALRLLRDEGKIDADYAVPVRVVADENAVELSTVENVQREAMHPADEYEAFRRMVDEGAGVETVAAHFGTTAAVVQRRLKLARVAASLLALYRAGDMSLDQLMALTVSDDHAAQEQVWQSRPCHRRAPAELRSALLGEASIASDSPLAVFVGRNAYLAAGGREQVDLFSEHGAHWSDGALARQLAQDRLQEQADAIRAAEGWAWATAMVLPDYTEIHAYGQARQSYREPNADEQTVLEQLAHRQHEITQRMEALELGEDNAADEEYEQLSQELDGIYRTHSDLDDARLVVPDKTLAGVIVALRRHGVEVTRGAIKPEDRKAMARAERAMARQAVADAAGVPVQPSMPEKLVRALTAQRTAALQASLIEQQSVALATLAYAMVMDLAPEVYYREESGVRLSVKSVGHDLMNADPAVEQSRAWQQIEASSEMWSARLPGEPDALWAHLLRMPSEDLIALLAHCTALSIDGIQSRVGPDATDALARAVGLDMADWWSATPASYLGRVRKADVLQAVSEAASPAQAVPLASMKKGPLVEAAAHLLAGTRWVPPLLRLQAA